MTRKTKVLQTIGRCIYCGATFSTPVTAAAQDTNGNDNARS